MKKVVFLIDLPNWSFDILAHRLASHWTTLEPIYHYLHKTLGDDSDFSCLPKGDVYYCMTWGFLWEVLKRRLVQHPAKYITHIADEYSVSRKPTEYSFALANADLVLSLTLKALEQDPLISFLPSPVAMSFLSHPRPKRKPGPFRIGMMANGWGHDGKDHKGVNLARQVLKDIPDVELVLIGDGKWVPNSEMPKWFDGIDAFMSLSLSEGFSGAITDALSLDVPVIGTPVSPLEPFLGQNKYVQIERTPESIKMGVVKIREQIAEGQFSSSRDFLYGIREEVLSKKVERMINGLYDAAPVMSPPMRVEYPTPEVQTSVIHAALASIPSRSLALTRVVDSLLPQVDYLHVYLNEYSSVPPFLIHPKIEVTRSQDFGDFGDAGKFWWASKVNGYYLTCDDDLLYPSDYVQTLIEGIEKYGRKAVVSFHGDNYQKAETFERSRKRFPCLHEYPRTEYSRVDMPGTGVMGLHTSLIKIPMEAFPIPNMADVWLTCLLKRKSIPVYLLPSLGDWLSVIPGSGESAIWDSCIKTDGSLRDTHQVQHAVAQYLAAHNS